MDGNFKMEQNKPKRPQDDVSLTNVSGMMTAPARYEAHLKVAKDTRGVSFTFWACISLKLSFSQRSTCNDHKAVNLANSKKPHLRATGVGATACARHGCFVPQLVVDFQKGER